MPSSFFTFREIPGDAITGTPHVLIVDGAAGCAGECPPFFRDVARVVEPLSQNPGLLVPQPLGIDGVRKVLELLDAWRKERGIAQPAPQGNPLLVDLVNAMRVAQIEYFRTKSTAALDKARRLEREVDQALARIRIPQKELFG